MFGIVTSSSIGFESIATQIVPRLCKLIHWKNLPMKLYMPFSISLDYPMLMLKFMSSCPDTVEDTRDSLKDLCARYKRRANSNCHVSHFDAGDLILFGSSPFAYCWIIQLQC